jgi:hypothetical protein
VWFEELVLSFLVLLEDPLFFTARFIPSNGTGDGFLSRVVGIEILNKGREIGSH